MSTKELALLTVIKGAIDGVCKKVGMSMSDSTSGVRPWALCRLSMSFSQNTNLWFDRN